MDSNVVQSGPFGKRSPPATGRSANWQGRLSKASGGGEAAVLYVGAAVLRRTITRRIPRGDGHEYDFHVSPMPFGSESS